MKTEKELFEKAEKLYHGYNESRYPKAIEAFKILLQYYPNNIQGWCMLSTMQSCFKLFNDAISSIDEAIKLDSKNNSIWDQKRILLHEIDRLEYEINSFPKKEDIKNAIIFVCNEQIKIVPDNYYDLGKIIETKARSLKFLGEWESSIKEYEKVIQFHEAHSKRTILNPVASCLFSIAQIYENMNDYDSAIKFFDLANEAEYQEIIMTHKARVLNKKGEKLSSDSLLDEFIDIVTKKFQDTKDAAYMFQIADVYKERDMKDKAIAILDDYRIVARKYDGLDERIDIRRQELLEN